MDNTNQNNSNNPIENTDLAKQYQDILDRYSKELSSTKKDPAPEPEPETVSVTVPETTADQPSEPEITTPIELTEVSPKIELPEAPVIPERSLPPMSVLPPTPVFETNTPVAPAPPKGNLFKYLFFVSLIIFLGVFGGIAYTILFTQSPTTGSQDITPTGTQPVVTDTTKYCEVNDKKIKQGESFPATDGCNTCSCGPDLTVVCTLMACEATPSVTTTVATSSATPSVTPTEVPLVDNGPLKTILVSINTSLKTTYKEMTLDKGKSGQLT